MSKVGFLEDRPWKVDSSSVIYRMCVRIPTWSVATLLFLSKALYHDCFSLPRKKLGTVQKWGVTCDGLPLQGGGEVKIFSVV